MEKDDLFDFEFDKTEKYWSVTGYYGKSEEMIFPEFYKGKSVKKIACSFSPNQRKRIKRIIIPEGYTSIGERAFKGCTKLTNIELPESLISIGEWAFAGCKGLINIKLPKNLLSIGYRSILEDSGDMPLGSIIGDLGDSIFSGCTGLTNIELPEGLTFIGTWVFCDCTGLKNIKLPESLTSIGEGAFIRCTGLTNIKLPESLTSIENNTFRGCTGLTNIKLPENLISIKDEAFIDCTGLTNIKFPKSLTFIGDRVFEGCKNIAEITVDKNNPVFCSVDGVMFDKAMTTLLWFPEKKKGRYSVPDGIISIKSDAFGNNCKLTGIYFPKSLLCVTPHSLNRINGKLTNITVSELNPVYCSIDGVLFDKEKRGLILYPKNKGKTNYVIPDGIQYIGEWAFAGCSLVNIVLPESIRSIGDCAFAFCKCLKTITLSNKLRDSIENVKGRTFSGNSRIGTWAFEGFEGQFIYRD